MIGLDSIKQNVSKCAIAVDVLSRVTVDTVSAQTVASCALYAGDNRIATYPNFATASYEVGRIQLARALGCAVWAALSKDSKEIWKRKLVSATESETSQFWSACVGSQGYSNAVRTIKHAVPRLVAIHIANGMIAARIPFTQALRNKDHPCAEGLRTGTSKYSLIPLLSAYAPDTIRYVPPDFTCTDGSDFADFFVEYVHGFACIGESSVRGAASRLVESMKGE